MTLFLLLACGTQSGTEKRNHDTGEDPCTSSETEIAADEVTSAGFSAEDVLAWLTVGATGTLTWTSGGTTAIHLDFTDSGGSPTWVDYEQAADVDTTCETPDRMWIPVGYALRTEDGTIDESSSYGVFTTDGTSSRIVLTLKSYTGGDPACTEPDASTEVELDATVRSDGTTTGTVECGSAGTTIAEW